MRLLADENVPERILLELEAGGHDVARVRLRDLGADDPTVLALAAAEQRLLLTLDRGFGELASREISASAGVVILRFRRPETMAIAAALLRLLAEEGERLHQHLTILRVGSRRLRPLPFPGA